MDGTIWGQMAKELFEAKPDCFHLAFVGNKKGNEANYRQGLWLGCCRWSLFAARCWPLLRALSEHPCQTCLGHVLMDTTTVAWAVLQLM